MAIALSLIVLGVVVGLVLARAVLGGLLRMMIRDARQVLRRLRERRAARRGEDHDRRNTERRSAV